MVLEILLDLSKEIGIVTVLAAVIVVVIELVLLLLEVTQDLVEHHDLEQTIAETNLLGLEYHIKEPVVLSKSKKLLIALEFFLLFQGR